jgi:hypothetical protein
MSASVPSTSGRPDYRAPVDPPAWLRRTRSAAVDTAPAEELRPFAGPIGRLVWHPWAGHPAIAAAVAWTGAVGYRHTAFAAARTRSRRAGPRPNSKPPRFVRCAYASVSLPDRGSIPAPAIRHNPPSLYRRDGAANLRKSGELFRIRGSVRITSATVRPTSPRASARGTPARAATLPGRRRRRGRPTPATTTSTLPPPLA